MSIRVEFDEGLGISEIFGVRAVGLGMASIGLRAEASTEVLLQQRSSKSSPISAAGSRICLGEGRHESGDLVGLYCLERFRVRGFVRHGSEP